MESTGEPSIDQAALLAWWSDLRERGSDVAIVGTGARKRIVKNNDLLSMIYFLRRWVARGRKSWKRRRYGNSVSRLYRQKVLSALGKRGLRACLKYWIHRLNGNCKLRKDSVKWINAEDHAESVHARKRLKLALGAIHEFQIRNGVNGGYKARQRRLKEYLGVRRVKLLAKTLRFWAFMIRKGRRMKGKAFKAMRDSFRLNKLSVVWKKLVMKEAFLRFLRRGRWALVQQRYVSALKVPAKLSFWHILALLRKRMRQVNKLGDDYFLDCRLNTAFQALRGREAARRMRRIHGYVVLARRRLAVLARYLKKLAAVPDPKVKRRKEKLKGKCDDFRFMAACGKAMRSLAGGRREALRLEGQCRKGYSAFCRKGLRAALEEWQAHLITKKRQHRLVHFASGGKKMAGLKLRRAWAAMQRWRLYAFVYRNDTTLANAFFTREYFRQFKLTLDSFALSRQQEQQALTIVLARRRAPALSTWRAYATASMKLQRAVRHFAMNFKVKRRWFLRHFTHVRLQHRVRMAATYWHHRKVCKAAVKAMVHRVRACRREQQRLRTFRLLCPVPRCSIAPQAFHAWKTQYLPRARRLRVSSETVQARRQRRVRQGALEIWSDLYFSRHARKHAMRSALRHLIQLVVRRRAAWLKVAHRCSSSALSSLEKERLSEVLGKHRLALRCGQTDVESTFLRAIADFGQKVGKASLAGFSLRALLRCQHLRRPKAYFTTLVRTRRAFVAWARDYTVRSRQARLAHAERYAAVARRAANYQEASLTAAEMGKFAVVMRVFFRWRDPLRRRNHALGRLLRKTHARSYLRRWYLAQRKSFIDRTLPLSALASSNGRHARLTSATSHGGYSSAAHVARSRSASPSAASGRNSTTGGAPGYLGGYGSGGGGYGAQEITPALPRGRPAPAPAPAPVPAAQSSRTHRRSHSQPPSSSSSSTLPLSSSLSAPLSERAAQLAAELQARLRGEVREEDAGTGTDRTASRVASRGRLTAAQKAMSYDRTRREQMRKKREGDMSGAGGFTVHRDNPDLELDVHAGSGSGSGSGAGVTETGRRGTGPFTALPAAPPTAEPLTAAQTQGLARGPHEKEKEKEKENVAASVASPSTGRASDSDAAEGCVESQGKEKKRVRWVGLRDSTNSHGSGFRGSPSKSHGLLSKLF